MAVNDNRKKIRFRRGEEANLVSPLNTEKIAYGQPIYNATKNYLTIGDSTGNKTYKNLRPLDVRRVRGYFSDDSQMSGLTPENKLYYMTGKDNNLELYSQGGFQLWTGSKAWIPSDPDAVKTFEVYRNQYAQFHVPMRSDIIRTQNIKTSTNDTDAITLSNNLITLNKDLSSAYDITTNKLNGVLTSEIFESDNKTTKNTTNVTSKIDGIDIKGVNGIFEDDGKTVKNVTVLQNTGSSTTQPMSQKAVTDLFNGEVLFEDATGVGVGTVDLSEYTFLNGDIIEVYFRKADSGSLMQATPMIKSAIVRETDFAYIEEYGDNSWDETFVSGAVGGTLSALEVVSADRNLQLFKLSKQLTFGLGAVKSRKFDLVTNKYESESTDPYFLITKVIRYRY